MNTLDVQGLPGDQIQFLQDLIAFLRQKFQTSISQTEQPFSDETETIALRNWSLGVKGEISREGIYDYLDESADGTR
jgi:hypothetical protein